MKQVHIHGLFALALMAGPVGASAQGLEEVKSERVKLGGGIVLAVPTGEFSDFVGLGGGANLFALFNFDRNGLFGLRLDGSVLSYGHERITQPLSNTIQRVSVDVTTNNWIASFGLGPQLTLGSGPIRPYVYGTVGFSYFATVSSVSGTADFDHSFASSTNFDDVTFASSGGAGVLIQLSNGTRPVALDMSVRTLRNGVTEYLRRGSIQERSDGSVFITPIQSEANLVTVKLGVSVGVG